MAHHNPLQAILVPLLVYALGIPPAGSEELTVVGTGDGLAILSRLAAAFGQAHPGDQVGIPESIGSSGGIKAVGTGRARLGRVARTIKQREAPYGLSYLPIARFPVVFFVNDDVTLTDLAAPRLLAIYAGKLDNWQAVGGPDSRIRVVRREEGDSSLGNLRTTFPGFAGIRITGRSKTTTSTQDTLAEVATRPGAIGFGPYTDAVNAGLKVLNVDGHRPTDEDYPSYGVLALVFKAAERHGIVARFIDFATSPPGRAAIRAAHGLPFR